MQLNVRLLHFILSKPAAVLTAFYFIKQEAMLIAVRLLLAAMSSKVVKHTYYN